MTGIWSTTRARARALAAVVALGLAATACGSSGDEGTATAGSAPTTEASATGSDAATADTSTGTIGAADQGSSTSTGGAGSSSTTAAPAMEGGLGVSPDGLQLIDGARITQLPFGTSRDEVFTILEEVLGVSPTATLSSPECGNQADEQLLWPGQLSVDIRDDQMISWQLDRDSPLTTVSGVGLGSTRAEVESSIVIMVDESSLGTEFATEGSGEGGGMGGLLTGPEDTGTVTELWAGEICAFR